MNIKQMTVDQALERLKVDERVLASDFKSKNEQLIKDQKVVNQLHQELKSIRSALDLIEYLATLDLIDHLGQPDRPFQGAG